MYNKRMSKIYDDCLKRFNDTKDYDDRACLEDIITHFQRFVGEANPHLFTIMYLDGHYEDYVTFGPMNMRKEYEDYTVANKDFFTNIFNHFTNLELKEEVNNKTFVPNTSEIVEDFLKTVDMDLYNLFINSKDNMFRVYEDGGGRALYDPVKDQIYVLFGRRFIFENMVALVHEMGHCYRDHLVKKLHYTTSLEEHLKSELYSQILEYLFLNYLINNDIYAIDAKNYLDIDCNKIIRSSRTLCENIFVHDNGVSTISDIKYLLGRIVARYYINSGIPLKEFFTYLENHTLLEILNELNINYQEISDGIRKNYCLKKQ